MKNKEYKKFFEILLFILWIVLNVILIIRHEPWRDEARAWLLSKNLSVKDLFIVSKFDGHPILWHLILMPFAKLDLPYITVSVVNFLICIVAAFIFYFKIQLNKTLKIIIIFGVPFIYVYTTIARNYSLILLLVILISYFYHKRYKHPYLYTLLICFLLCTPTTAWGLSIALFLSFNISELIKLLKHKNQLTKQQILYTILMFFLIFGIVSFELYGTSNPDYKPSSFLYFNRIFIMYIFFSLTLFGICCFAVFKSFYREYFVAFTALIAQVFIVMFYYQSLLEIRLQFQCIVWLMFIIICSNNNLKYPLLMPIIFIIFYFPMSVSSYKLAYLDINYNYSSGKETAIWINNNINDKEILVEESIFCQSIVPYLNNIEVYDIYYEEKFNKLKMYSDTREKRNIDLEKYSGKYIVIYNSTVIDKYKNLLSLVYTSKKSLTNEDFKIYYIK